MTLEERSSTSRGVGRGARKEQDMRHEDVIEVMTRPISQELLRSSIPARLAYVGPDGAPRVIPIGFHWDGARIVMATIPHSRKVAALQQNPRVSLTIDTQDQWPPRVLLVRGAARVDLVDGIPDAYIEASRKITPAEHFPAWEKGVRAMYERMALITVEPDWAKLLDFETTLPEAVGQLVRPATPPPH
jgi:Pyridoxamine 5'-phosphate oxidase